MKYQPKKAVVKVKYGSVVRNSFLNEGDIVIVKSKDKEYTIAEAPTGIWWKIPNKFLEKIKEVVEK